MLSDPFDNDLPEQHALPASIEVARANSLGEPGLHITLPKDILRAVLLQNDNGDNDMAALLLLMPAARAQAIGMALLSEAGCFFAKQRHEAAHRDASLLAPAILEEIERERNP